MTVLNVDAGLRRTTHIDAAERVSFSEFVAAQIDSLHFVHTGGIHVGDADCAFCGKLARIPIVAGGQFLQVKGEVAAQTDVAGIHQLEAGQVFRHYTASCRSVVAQFESAAEGQCTGGADGAELRILVDIHLAACTVIDGNVGAATVQGADSLRLRIADGQRAAALEVHAGAVERATRHRHGAAALSRNGRAAQRAGLAGQRGPGLESQCAAAQIRTAGIVQHQAAVDVHGAGDVHARAGVSHCAAAHLVEGAVVRRAVVVDAAGKGEVLTQVVAEVPGYVAADGTAAIVVAGRVGQITAAGHGADGVGVAR